MTKNWKWPMDICHLLSCALMVGRYHSKKKKKWPTALLKSNRNALIYRFDLLFRKDSLFLFIGRQFVCYLAFSIEELFYFLLGFIQRTQLERCRSIVSEHHEQCKVLKTNNNCDKCETILYSGPYRNGHTPLTRTISDRYTCCRCNMIKNDQHLPDSDSDFVVD